MKLTEKNKKTPSFQTHKLKVIKTQLSHSSKGKQHESDVPTENS